MASIDGAVKTDGWFAVLVKKGSTKKNVLCCSTEREVQEMDLVHLPKRPDGVGVFLRENRQRRAHRRKIHNEI